MEKIGFVGTGAMGCALLERLRSAGIKARVYDIARSALDEASSLGAEVVSSAKAVAESSTLIDVVVRSDQDVLDCTLGKNGLLEGAASGTLILLHSTIRPETTKRVAEAAKQREVYVIDACMTAVPSIVRQGGLTFLVGGPMELLERARPHLETMSKQVIHMGPLGTGNVAKLIKNLVTGSEGLIVYEAIRIGQAGGIAPEEALEMMRKTHSMSVLERWQQRYDLTGTQPRMRVGQNLYDKDIPLAAEVGRALGVEVPITEELAAESKRLVAQARAK